MTSIRGFLIDLFDDLRARRLLPVAVLLLAGLVAVPVLLSKKAEEPAVPPAEPAATSNQPDEPKGPDALAQVRLDDLDTGSGSSLSAFDADNPFAPPDKVIAAARREAAGDTGAPAGDLVPGPTTGGTGTGTTGGAPTEGTGDDGGGTDDGGGGGGETKTTEFTYVIDVTFWANGRRRDVDGMEKLDMLPNAAMPLLIFMGVTEGGGNSVFLVDSTLQTAGEGRCKPSRDECGILYLGPGSEQEFTNEDGDSYRLRIDQIRKVKVDGDASGAASSKREGKSARAALGQGVSVRRFVPPVLTDLVVQSNKSSDDSTPDGRGR